MSQQGMDAAGVREYLITGKAPELSPEIKADIEAQAAKRRGETPKPPEKPTEKPAEPKAETKGTDPDPDDIEGEDGLTPRQKRDFTAAMQKTIAKKHRAQKEAEEFAANEYNRTQLAEQRAANAERELERLRAASKPAEPKVEAPKAPNRADFETDEAYADALIDYRVDAKLRAKAAEDEKRAEEAAQAEVLAQAKARIERAIELVPDFREVTESADLNVPPHIARYMQASPMFGELGYHFAKNPGDLEKLAALTAGLRPGTDRYIDAVTRALVDLGKIESKLSPFAAASAATAKVDPPAEKPAHGAEPSTETGTAPSKPRVTAPMIRPLNAGASASVQPELADMKVSDHLKAVQQRSGTNLTVRKRH